MSSLEKLRKIKKNIEANNVKLIAVSKTHPANDILPLLEAGHRVFGENRVQEAKEKWVELREKYSDIQLHLIGSLQTNKVKDALKLFDVIQSIDRISLVDEIVRHKKMLCSQFFIQVNIGNEAQKGGVALDELENLINYTKDKLPIIGLMCVPPADKNPEQYFSLLQELAKKYNVHNLSMGMSNDYDIAIKYGATHIRVGTAIFGERTNN